jgi:DNA polymerase III sliding clamp (beta) subunit (PCNA family)
MNDLLELPVAELKRALTGFNKVVTSRIRLPVLGQVRLQAAGQTINLQVTDLDCFATYSIVMPVAVEFPTCLLPLAALGSISKCAKDTIGLAYGEDNRFKLRHLICNTPVEQAIESLPLEEWPSVPQIDGEPLPVEPGFKDAFRQALECASCDSTRSLLNGACLDVSRPDCHCLVGCDGKHLFQANNFQFPWSESVVVPNRRFFSWSGLAEDGDWRLTVQPHVPRKEGNPAYIQLQSEHWTFITRCLEGTYPDWRQVIPPQDRDGTSVRLTDEAVGSLLDALARMPGPEEPSQPVMMLTRPGLLVLRSRPGAGDQWTEVPIAGVTVSGPEQRICVNRIYLIKALRFGFVQFKIQDHLSPIIFSAAGKTLIAMPMRFADAPEPTPIKVDDAQRSPQPVISPAESAEPAYPSAVQPINPTEEINAMATNNITALPAPELGRLKPTNGSNGETSTAMKAVVDQVEKIKAHLREVISDLNTTLDLLKAAEKEKRATLKEVESVRATLRSLQKVEL